LQPLRTARQCLTQPAYERLKSGPAYNRAQFKADPGPTHFLKAFCMPSVQADSFLTLHYRLAGLAGDGVELINTFMGKPATLSLGAGELSPALESQLIGLSEGDRARFELQPGEAFGPRNPDLVQWVARKLLDELGDPQEQYAAGDVVQFPTPDGLGNYAGTVVQLGPEGAVQMDFNHPLAGQAVVFEVQVIGVL
jgi:FKBP-type peptidyl-prolyl cis-trans isomerase SlpA